MNGEKAPIDVGETYEVTINAVGEKGDGIARVKGFVLFVPGVQKGEVVKIRVTKVLPKVGFAEVLEKLGAAVYEKKFETISKEELHTQESEPEQHYEDTEDFGDDLEE